MLIHFQNQNQTFLFPFYFFFNFFDSSTFALTTQLEKNLKNYIGHTAQN